MNAIKFNFVLDDLLEESWGEPDPDDSLLLCRSIGEDQSVLVEESTLLIDDICVKI